MNISKINNVSFGNTYYKGLSTKNPKNEFYFERRNISDLVESAKRTLTDKQKRVTYVIEKQLFPDRFERQLNWDLEDKNTDIIFKYESDGNMSLYLSKYGTGSWGDEYAFTPYNKDGTREIKETFSVKDITLKEIKEKTKNFIQDCKAYLKDSNNPKNKAIEEKLWDKW